METVKTNVDKKYYLFGVIPLWKVTRSEYTIIPDEVAEKYDVAPDGTATIANDDFTKVLQGMLPFMNPNMYSTEDVINTARNLKEFEQKLKEGGGL